MWLVTNISNNSKQHTPFPSSWLGNGKELVKLRGGPIFWGDVFRSRAAPKFLAQVPPVTLDSVNQLATENLSGFFHSKWSIFLHEWKNSISDNHSMVYYLLLGINSESILYTKLWLQFHWSAIGLQKLFQIYTNPLYFL